MNPNINTDDPAGIVPKYFPMDPETEDMLFADALADGMIVLSEPECRYDEKDCSPDKLRTYNRWCEVTDIRFEEDGLVFFIGKYADRAKAVRSSRGFQGWIVKKDSMPVVDETKHATGPFAGLAKNLAPRLTTLSGREKVVNPEDCK